VDKLDRDLGRDMTNLSTLPQFATWYRKDQTSLWSYLTLALLFGMRLASEHTAMLAYIGLGAYALLGRGNAVRALAFSWLFTLINPGLAPEANGVGRYAVLFGAAASAFLHGAVLTVNLKVQRFTALTMLLGLFLVGHSLLFSPIVDVSVLKAVSWAVAIVTLISCWTGMSPQERDETTRHLFWGLVLLMLASLPLIISPIGYLRNNWSFQGVLNQPQVFGTTMALLGSWATARILADRNPSWLMIGLPLVCVVLVSATAARTAGLALVGAIALSVVLAPLLSGKPVKHLFAGLSSTRVWIVIFGALIVGCALAPFLAEKMNAFVTKNGGEGSLLDSYTESRSVLVKPMLENIAENPFVGIGFGIGSDYTNMVVERDAILGLPTGAATEKGVTFIAVIEEIGLFGAALVFFWFVNMVLVCARGGLVPLTICFTILLFNLGEATFFSPGGMGMLLLIMATWAYSQGSAEKRHA